MGGNINGLILPTLDKEHSNASVIENSRLCNRTALIETLITR
jgi:hypothetical protein